MLYMTFSLTDPFRQAGQLMSDCQPRRDPGLACSRMVRRLAIFETHLHMSAHLELSHVLALLPAGLS